MYFDGRMSRHPRNRPSRRDRQAVIREASQQDGWTTFGRFSSALWETFVDVATSRAPRERKGWEYRKGIEGMSMGSMAYEMMTMSEDTKDFKELQKEYEAGYGVPFLNLSSRKLTEMTRDENGDAKKASQAGMHASGFKDFLLKPELLRAIVDCGFEHPSEVQHECIPQAILGTDVLCQAKSGMGKTAVFVLACLQQIDSSEKAVRTMVVCHTRELAYQIKQEFERFSKYFPGVKSAVVYGGTPMSTDKEMLKDCRSTPDLKLDKLQHFVLDECDKCLDKIDMRKDVQSIFMESPKKKQVMMFSATMSAETRALCKKFMTEPHEIRVDEESKLTLHGLLQYYVKLTEKEKNRKLNDLLDALEFNQVVIFVKSVQRAVALDKLLVECNFPSIAIHSGLQQDERIARYKQFKEFQKRILVATDLFGRGIDIERVNIVINYDMPDESDSYLHRVGRAGRFGTKGLALTFVATDEDQEVLQKVQERFEVNIGEMPGQIAEHSVSQAVGLDGPWLSLINVLQTIGVNGAFIDGIPVQNKWINIVQENMKSFANEDPDIGQRHAADLLQNMVMGRMERITGAPMPVFLEGYGESEGIYKIVIGPRSVVVVSDPVIVKRILTSSPELYTKGILSEVLEPIMGHGLIPADPETWKARRRAIVPGFHKKWLEDDATGFGELDGNGGGRELVR
eukprot:g7845.t1